MQYKELETQVYALLRSGRLTEASLAVLRAPAFHGPERYDLLCLKANVKLLTSPLNAARCLSVIEEIVGAPDAAPETRMKAALLGAHIAREAPNAERWRTFLGVMWDLVVLLPEYKGRTIRSEALLHEDAGDVREAIRWHQLAVEWHADNIGPHDERDRLCQLGLSQASLVALYAKMDRIDDAREALGAAEQAIPDDATQRVYVPAGRMALCLATGDIETAGNALTEARTLLTTRKDDFASRHVDRLEVEFLIKSGDMPGARIVLDRLARQGCAERNLTALRRFRAMAFSSA